MWERLIAWMIGFCTFSAIVYLVYAVAARVVQRFRKAKPARNCGNCLWLSGRVSGFGLDESGMQVWDTVYMCGLPGISPVMYVTPEHSCDQFKGKQ